MNNSENAMDEIKSMTRAELEQEYLGLYEAFLEAEKELQNRDRVLQEIEMLAIEGQGE